MQQSERIYVIILSDKYWKNQALGIPKVVRKNTRLLRRIRKKNFSHHLRSLHRVFAQCWRARQRNFFLEKFLSFRFSRSLKAIRWAMNKARTSVCCSKYYQNDFRC